MTGEGEGEEGEGEEGGEKNCHMLITSPLEIMKWKTSGKSVASKKGFAYLLGQN
jgi:hypothetical protein